MEKRKPTDEELIAEWNRLYTEHQQFECITRNRAWANAPGRKRWVEKRLRTIRREAQKRGIDFL